MDHKPNLAQTKGHSYSISVTLSVIQYKTLSNYEFLNIKNRKKSVMQYDIQKKNILAISNSQKIGAQLKLNLLETYRKFGLTIYCVCVN